MSEILIRDIDNQILSKLDYMAKKKGISRNKYIKGVLTNYAIASEVKALDSKYQELMKIVIDTIEGNTQILHEILNKIQGDKS